jgi:hypothetical protein
MNAFRRHNSEGLPTTFGNSSAKPSRFSFGTNSPRTNGGSYGGGDGSAASIHLQSPVLRAIQKSSRTVRISYGCVVGFLLFMATGYRWIRSQNASVWLTCHKQECHLQITPTGHSKSISLHLARRQLVATLPVKTLADGTFVTQDAIKLNDEWKARKDKKANKKGSSKHTPSYTYKGPDEHGFYLSYAILLRDKDATVDGSSTNKNEAFIKPTSDAEETERDDVDLTPIRAFLDTTEEAGVHRLVLRKFRLSQTKRRVRTMTQKVESYIKRRRHKLLLKENAPPSWQGILICIVGLIGMLLSLLFGQFWDEDVRGSSGPGVRRQKKQDHNPHKPKKMDDSAFQTQTPARYEVASGPKPLGMRKRT